MTSFDTKYRLQIFLQVGTRQYVGMTDNVNDVIHFFDSEHTCGALVRPKHFFGQKADQSETRRQGGLLCSGHI